jgi:putative spermidine/putrescine transport system ATP-binding protein
MSRNDYAVELRGISKNFKHIEVLRRIDLSIKHGEVLALLGPSGCGKSTTLNIVAGFFPPDKGQILLDGKVMNQVPTHKRNLGMVFQGHSLFPFMSVFDNVAFGLSVRSLPRAEIYERVNRALSLVRVLELADRFPMQLSGGEQQRVAIARALVVNPKVLLLDEPLSNLDSRLRKDLQLELRRIHDDTGVTMIYVTHDQEEAVMLADRIALMHEGGIEQIGNPLQVFDYPSTRFVAHFMGYNNFLIGRVISQRGNDIKVRLAGGEMLIISDRSQRTLDDVVTLTIREERIKVNKYVASREGKDIRENFDVTGKENRILGHIMESIYTGSNYIFYIHIDGNLQLQVRVGVNQISNKPPGPGMLVELSLPKDDLRVISDRN